MSWFWYSAAATAALFICFSTVLVLLDKSSNAKSIVVLVIGDVSRSPRMIRHCESCLQYLPQNFHIHFVGFISDSFITSFTNSITSSLSSATEKDKDKIKEYNERVHFHNIWSYRPTSVHFAIYAVCKVVSEILSLLWILIINPLKVPCLSFIIMQNPPTIPAAWIARVACWIRFGFLIIDFHNFGFSILALKRQKAQKDKFVGYYRDFEQLIGSWADAVLCVTDAMKQFLHEKWEYPKSLMKVLKDRPNKLFLKNLNAIQISNEDDLLFDTLRSQPFFAKRIPDDLQNKENKIKALKKNDLWLISSTSWTPDEDVSMLVTAPKAAGDDTDHSAASANSSDTLCVLAQLDAQIATLRAEKSEAGAGTRGDLVLFITGKDDGQLREEFLKLYEKLKLSHVFVVPLWLERYESYVHLLRQSDLGVCFHSSSSGLDLPMKVVDMYGVGIPVVAKDFDELQMQSIMGIKGSDCMDTALKELVVAYPPGKATGLVFGDEEELVDALMECYSAFAGLGDERMLVTFKHNIGLFRKQTWEQDWQKVMMPLMSMERDYRSFWLSFYGGVFVIVASGARLYFLNM